MIHNLRRETIDKTLRSKETKRILKKFIKQYKVVMDLFHE